MSGRAEARPRLTSEGPQVPRAPPRQTREGRSAPRGSPLRTSGTTRSAGDTAISVTSIGEANGGQFRMSFVAFGGARV
jgi:hypothetical protein